MEVRKIAFFGVESVVSPLHSTTWLPSTVLSGVHVEDVKHRYIDPHIHCNYEMDRQRHN